MCIDRVVGSNIEKKKKKPEYNVIINAFHFFTFYPVGTNE